MAHVLKPRVAETSTTTGTGAFTLAGALSGHQRFSAVCATSDTTEYVIVADDGTWEEGLGTYSSANTLTRTTVTNSSNAGSAVNFAAGNKTVLMTPLASRVGGIPRSTSMVKGDGSGALTAASAGTDYQAAITATGLLKGAGSGSVSAATAGTDYLAPPSGTALLKANSGGALANASAGTDYASPSQTFYIGTTQVAINRASAALTLNGITLTDPAIVGTITEDVFTITDGASVDIDPANGSIQLWTLGANRTPTATNFLAGESVTLMVDDGTAYSITWTTIGVVWKTDNGSAPALLTTGYTPIVLWKIGSTIYGARVGNA